MERNDFNLKKTQSLITFSIFRLYSSLFLIVLCCWAANKHGHEQECLNWIEFILNVLSSFHPQFTVWCVLHYVIKREREREKVKFGTPHSGIWSQPNQSLQIRVKHKNVNMANLFCIPSSGNATLFATEIASP